VRTAALFDSAMAGLQSAQSGMLVTSQNVTGSSVEGYVRRTSSVRINGLSPSSIDLTGTSFAVEGFTRYFDNLLQGQLLSQQSKTSYSQALTQSVAPLDAMLTEPANSIATALGNFFNAAGSIANEPTNSAYQQSLIGNARLVADRVRGLANSVGQISSNASQALADVLNQANSLTPQLASVNAKIRSAATPGLSTASPDLLDERDRIVGKLQELVGGATLVNEDGTASYLLNGQHLVDREIANTFSNNTGTTVIRSDMRLSDLRIKVATLDGLKPIYINLVMPAVAQKNSNGEALLDTNGNSMMVPGQSVLQDGKAGAYVHLIQNFVPTVQKSINLLATQLVKKVNQITDGRSPANGIAPIFGFASSASNGSSLTGISSDTAGNTLLDALWKKPNNTGEYTYSDLVEGSNPQSSNYRETIDKALSKTEFDARQFKVVGTFDNSQFTYMDATASASLQSLRDSFTSPVTFITSSVATTIATWKNTQQSDEALQKSLSEQKSSITGVNLDEEAANLVKYQQLYNASSKLMQTGKQMFDTLLGMLSG
jgi:flagellar hook-associated protein 1 FlgK